MNNNQIIPVTEIPEAPPRFRVRPWKTYSKLYARLFWLLGLVGLPWMHHYYLGNKWRAILYGLTFGLFYLGWIVDGFLINYLVDRSDSDSLWAYRNPKIEERGRWVRFKHCYYCFNLDWWKCCRKRATKEYYLDEANRVQSFVTPKSEIEDIEWPSGRSAKLHPKVMAAAGFYFSPTEETRDKVTCPVCEIEVWDWKPTDDAMARHLHHSSRCPLVGKPETEPSKILRNRANFDKMIKSIK
mmetsp:Transcript_25664/g.59136  ORF Transcript_25664/g.59136 Transcript_25664/m.59136 type:complete len:241 (-) Transcript_25664:97-819(-)|eukprot:CAMPEP_0114556832 /NCGR_PEP_ID=MMETSP0114-20121206/9496_1 /TAXON_ID=31324 /ORGANISM="Goniomonas sp, Strain m" /LENGTH=240 /DNA_ID=CAMNT_0001742057 /DNA_START=109 /DNA_END=831 /DNA_ORIENTATION=-